MPYWIRGRDSQTGEPTGPFFTETDDEEAARAEAAAQGIIVDSVEQLVAEGLQGAEQENAMWTCEKCCKTHDDSFSACRNCSTWTAFGISNLFFAATDVVAYSAIVFGFADSLFVRTYGFGWRTDTLFFGDLVARIVGVGALVAAGVGLLLKKPWGRSLSIYYAIAIMVIYTMMWIAGAIMGDGYSPLRYFFSMDALRTYIYPIVLLAFMMFIDDAWLPTAQVVEQTDQPKHRFRFALRHLFTVVTVLCGVFAAVGWGIRYPVQREILKMKYGRWNVQGYAIGQLRLMGPEAAEAVPLLIDKLYNFNPPGAADALLQIGVRDLSAIEVQVSEVGHTFQMH